MEVMSDDASRDREEPLEMIDGVRPGSVGAFIAEIAKMLAEEDVPTTDKRKYALELTAAGQDRLDRLVGEGDRQGHVAPRTAQEKGDSVDAPRYRVVAADLDRAIVSQKEIRNAAQPVHGVAIFEGDRLVAPIPTRHDQREVDSSEEQMLERRVGQHHAEMTQSRSHLIGHALTCPQGTPWQKHDGARGRLEQSRLRIRDDAESACRLEAAHHHGQRLRIARLATSQLANHL